MNHFSKWMTYLKERSPLPVLIFISAGIALSSMAFIGSFDICMFFIGIALNVLVLIQMRLGDEIKDFEKDIIMHPTRPLPRGLVTVKEVFTALIVVLMVVITSGVIVGMTKSWAGGIALISTTVFAWLMFKEFYIGHQLSKEPMTYALTHQVIVFPIHAWIAYSIDPHLINNPYFTGWLIANFGASFTFEICRKLDPNAHRLAGTYAHHYGRPLTAIFCSALILVSAYGANLAGYPYVAWPFLLILWLGVILWVSKPEKYKIPAAFSALSSTIILWTPAVKWLIQKWSES